MRGRYRGWELPVLILGLSIEGVGLVMTFTGDRTWGWSLILLGLALVVVVSRRVKKRTDDAARRNKRPHWNEELRYRDGP